MRFTFHIVQIKLVFFTSVSKTTLSFTFHIVQIKHFSENDYTEMYKKFTFHIVQIKLFHNPIALDNDKHLHST